jgi:hypothetical protein
VAQGFGPADARAVRRAKALRHIRRALRHSWYARRRTGHAHGVTSVAQGFSPASVRGALLMAVAPSLATLAFEWSTGIMPPHAIRAAAGLLIGVVVAWLVVTAADYQVN